MPVTTTGMVSGLTALRGATGCHQRPSLRSDRVHHARSATAVNPLRGSSATLRSPVRLRCLGPRGEVRRDRRRRRRQGLSPPALARRRGSPAWEPSETPLARKVPWAARGFQPRSLSSRAAVPLWASNPPLTRARIGDTLHDGNGTRVVVVNAFTTVNGISPFAQTHAYVRAVLDRGRPV